MPSKYFSDDELRCKCGCRQQRVTEVMIAKIDALREMMGVPMRATSGYRCENHPEEKKKDGSTTGAHVQGKAVDFAVYGPDATRVIAFAHALGFTGIGIKQHGPVGDRIVHLDIASNEKNQPRPWCWTYP